ncbi:MAG: hypothetical protein WC595_05135 [Candidatus Nanoarchaeia archaeon]
MNKYACDCCDRDFGTKDALEMHHQVKHLTNNEKKSSFLDRVKKKKKGGWIVFVMLMGVIVTGVWFVAQRGDSTLPNIDVPNEPIHWHPHLSIIIDGEEQLIPEGIGLGQVHQPTHTHESDGTIHLENNRPTAKTLTVGYFFEIWGKAFNKDCIFEYCTSKGTLKMTVNGKENNEFEKYMWKDKDEIIIEYKSNPV